MGKYFNSPESIQDEMSKIDYGIVNPQGKILKDEDWNGAEDFYINYRLQSPRKTVKYKTGVCWDQTELERHMFNKYLPGYKTRTFAIFQKNPDEASHTFLTFEDPAGKKYYFENSYHRIKGLYPIKDEMQAIRKVRKAMKQDKPDKGVEIYEYTKPPKYGMDTLQFMDYIKTKGTPING